MLSWNESAWFSMMVGAALKGTVVLGAAWLVAFALRGRSAAARHLVWTAAAAAVLAIPFLVGGPARRCPSPLRRGPPGIPGWCSEVLGTARETVAQHLRFASAAIAGQRGPARLAAQCGDAAAVDLGRRAPALALLQMAGAYLRALAAEPEGRPPGLRGRRSGAGEPGRVHAHGVRFSAARHLHARRCGRLDRRAPAYGPAARVRPRPARRPRHPPAGAHGLERCTGGTRWPGSPGVSF